ncbi:MAG TPA: TfuA-like protein [Bryocella sp.]|nr:TfuA-like protein [Bryocella sp.]
MRDTAIFLGPTLARADAERILDADYLPPICRGDLARLPDYIRFVGIIDGEFYQSLSVSPKEVVTLLRRGVTVCGASSMGALRAAETHKLGTIGVGKIFEMFRDGILDADDEVALVYEPDTYRKLSEPLVNLRAALSLAASAHIIDEHEKSDLALRLKSLYFPDRSLHALYSLAPKLRTFFTHTPPPDPKRDDALQLLHTIHQLREDHSRHVRFRDIDLQAPPTLASPPSPSSS